MSETRWREQWLARGGNRFMRFDDYVRPRLAKRERRAARRQLPAWLQERMAICLRCPHADPAIPQGCRLLAGASKCYRRRSTASCPADPPRWGPVAVAQP